MSGSLDKYVSFKPESLHECKHFQHRRVPATASQQVASLLADISTGGLEGAAAGLLVETLFKRYAVGGEMGPAELEQLLNDFGLLHGYEGEEKKSYVGRCILQVNQDDDPRLDLKEATPLLLRCLVSASQPRLVPVARQRHTWLHPPLSRLPVIHRAAKCFSDPVGVAGWDGGWICFEPQQASVDMDCHVPVLLTKLTVEAVNIASSPLDMELHSSNDGEKYTLAYKLRFTQRNFRNLPTGQASTRHLSQSAESFYFSGAHNNDDHPIMPHWDYLPCSNHASGVVHGLGTMHIARFWRWVIVNGNGSHYMGINKLLLFGVPEDHLLPAPQKVEGECLDSSSVHLRWEAVKGHVKEYRVLVQPGAQSPQTGCFFFTAPVSAQPSLTVSNLKPSSTYSFQVYAVASHEGHSEEKVAEMKKLTGLRRFLPTKLFERRDKSEKKEEHQASAEHHESQGVAGVPSAVWTTTLPKQSAAEKEWEVVVTTHVTSEEKMETKVAATPKVDKQAEKVEEKTAARTNQDRESRAALQTACSEAKAHVPTDLVVYAARYESQLQSISKGDFKATADFNESNAVTLFLSSTFDDTQGERNYMMEMAFPYLQNLCQANGLEFSVVDLRWGVRDDSTDDHMTIDICLGELQRCQKQSTTIGFVFLSTQRYGWRALPNRVSHEEFHTMLKYIPQGDARTTILRWYKEDANQTPSVFLLQRISDTEAKSGQLFWGPKGAQTIMQEAIWAAARAHPDEVTRDTWMVSVTEREVQKGMEQTDHVERAGLCLFRTIPDLLTVARTEEAAGKAKVYATLADEDRQLLDEMRERVRRKLPETCVRDYTVDWKEGGINLTNHRDYIVQATAEFLADMECRIRMALSKRRVLSPHEREVFHHASFCYKRATAFFGREQLKSDTVKLFTQTTGKLSVVVGESGTGKTSLLCAVASAPFSDNRCSIIRLCGTSSASSNARDLMHSICVQIQDIYKSDKPIPTSFSDLAQYLPSVLSLATQQQPLYIYIDSLDQLTDTDFARSQPLRWLPKVLPPHVVFSVTTLPNQEYGILRAFQQGGVEEKSFLFVPKVNTNDSLNILKEWLAMQKRTLQDTQWKSVETSLAEAVKAGDGKGVTMLYLRLVFDRISSWRSFQEPESLASTVLGLVDQVYNDLEKYHGEKLVSRFLQLLLCSKNGLSIDNLMDILSADDNVLGKAGEKGAVLQWHSPPIRRLPPLVFLRMRWQLGDYLVTRGANGVNVLALYHRQFQEAVDRRYLQGSARTETTEMLASYFSGKTAKIYSDRCIQPQPLYFMFEGRSTPNRQRLDELAYLYSNNAQYDRLAEMVCNLPYIEAKFIAGTTYASQLLGEYNTLLACPLVPPFLNNVTEFSFFVRKWFHVLLLTPSALATLASNSPAQGVVHQRALERWSNTSAEEGENRPWLKWVNAPQHFDPCISTFPRPQGDIAFDMCCAWAPKGEKYAVGSRGVCAVYDTISGSLLSKYEGHGNAEVEVGLGFRGGYVRACAFSPDASLIVTGGEDGVSTVWSTVDGQVQGHLVRHLDQVLGCAWAANDHFILTTSLDGTAMLWNPYFHFLIAHLEGAQGGGINCGVFSPDCRFVVTGAHDGSVVIWGTQPDTCGKALKKYQLHTSPVTCVRWHEHLLLSSAANTAVLSNSNTGKVERTFKGHTAEIQSCAFSSDGHEVVTVSSDEKGLVFKLSGELVGVMEGHNGIVFGCDWGTGIASQLILTVSQDNSTKLWQRKFILPQVASTEEGPAKVLRLLLEGDGSALHVLDFGMQYLRYSSPFTTPLTPSYKAQGPPHQDHTCADLDTKREKWVVTSYEKFVRVFNTDGMGLSRLEAEDGALTCAIWDPRGAPRIALCGHAGGVELRSVDDELLAGPKELQWYSAAAWSQDGLILLTCGDQRSVAWNTSEEDLIEIADLPNAVGCAITKKGDRVALMLGNGESGYAFARTPELSVFQVNTSEKLVTLQDDFSQSTTCCFTADEKSLAVAFGSKTPYGSGRVSLYDLSSGEAYAWFFLPNKANISRLVIASEVSSPSLIATDEDGHLFLLTLQEKGSSI